MDTNLTEEERKKIHEENQSKLKEVHYAIALKDEIIKSLKKELKI